VECWRPARLISGVPLTDIATVRNVIAILGAAGVFPTSDHKRVKSELNPG